VLKAVGWVESGWRQFTPQGRPLVSFDFGYGIMQITSGMAGAFGSAAGTIDPGTQSSIAGDYTFNIAYGARMLAQKWAAVPRIGNSDTSVVENWYYALWAYNGWGWVNNPNNPRFSRTGTPATDPSAFPYQERVLYLVAHPPKDADGNPLWQPVSVTLPSAKRIGTSPGPIAKLAHTHRQPPPPLAAAYRPGDIGSINPGGQVAVSVRVTNTGTQPWLAQGESAVALAYHVFTMSGDPFKPFSPFSPGVIAYGQGAVALPHTVLPGTSVTLRDVVHSPPAPGKYRIVWDLEDGVQEYFSSAGVLPRVQQLTVVKSGTPTLAPSPTPTAVPQPREGLLYVADTSVKDGTVLAARQSFRKGWLVFNPGQTPWTGSWALHRVSGRTFGKATISVGDVPACRATTVLATLKAPARPGRYTGVWRLTDPSGHRVGDELTVVVVVRGGPGPTPTPSRSTPTPTPRPHPGPTATPTPAG
jgi:hypothetical protein